MPRQASRAHRQARRSKIEYLRDPEAEEGKARGRVKEAEEAVRSDETRRKWFGGSKEHSGALGLGRKDADVEENKSRLERSRENLEDVLLYRRGE